MITLGGALAVAVFVGLIVWVCSIWYHKGYWLDAHRYME